MMLRRDALKLAGALTITGALGPSRSARAASDTIRLGTLAPKSSPWGKTLDVWIKAVNEKSGGRLELQIFFNGAMGDEDAMVGKIKSGQLDGILSTSIGLGKIYKPILAMHTPLFTSWTKLDAARNAMKAEFEKGAKDAGFWILGWCDMGLTRIFSQGFAVKVPEDLKNKKPVYVRADAVVPALYATIGGVTGVPLNVPEILPQLNTGAINAMLASCLMAEQLQWSSKFDNINDVIVGAEIGALAFSQKRIDALPADLRAILTDTGKVASNALTVKIRSEDEAAFNRLKTKLNLTSTNTATPEQTKWDAVFKQTRQKLVPGTYSAELLAKLEGYAR